MREREREREREKKKKTIISLINKVDLLYIYATIRICK